MLSPIGIDDKVSFDWDSFLAVTEFLFIKKIAIRNPTARLTKLTINSCKILTPELISPFEISISSFLSISIILVWDSIIAWGSKEVCSWFWIAKEKKINTKY